jgi:GR25 family glycosyltransferase involved in LPS biosynthesis
MKSFHIILPGHELGETLGYKNIEIAKVFGLDAQMHPGVKITKPFREEFAPYDITTIASKEGEYTGQQGCFLAHFQLWQKCLELDEPIIICEHDGVFIRELPEKCLKKFTDVLRLESFHHWLPEYVEKTESSLNNKVSVKTLKTRYRTFYVGYYGYVIKPSGASKLINQAQTVGIRSVDSFIDNRVVDIKSVTSSVVTLDKTYIGRVAELSTTNTKIKIG